MEKLFLLVCLITFTTFSCVNTDPVSNDTPEQSDDLQQTEAVTQNNDSGTSPSNIVTPPATIDTGSVTTETTATAAPPSTNIDHPIRPGKHAFTLQWIGWEEPGSVMVEFQEKDKYRVVGRQDGENNDFAIIDGVLTYEGNQKFQFDGELSSRVSFVNGGEVCVKNGPVHFRATGTRKYWRLQEKDNCEGGNVVDYFDIFF